MRDRDGEDHGCGIAVLVCGLQSVRLRQGCRGWSAGDDDGSCIEAQSVGQRRIGIERVGERAVSSARRLERIGCLYALHVMQRRPLICSAKGRAEVRTRIIHPMRVIVGERVLPKVECDGVAIVGGRDGRAVQRQGGRPDTDSVAVYIVRLHDVAKLDSVGAVGSEAVICRCARLTPDDDGQDGPAVHSRNVYAPVEFHPHCDSLACGVAPACGRRCDDANAAHRATSRLGGLGRTDGLGRVRCHLDRERQGIRVVVDVRRRESIVRAGRLLRGGAEYRHGRRGEFQTQRQGPGKRVDDGGISAGCARQCHVDRFTDSVTLRCNLRASERRDGTRRLSGQR